MTFYIPPVFLFGNKVRHNQEENKAKYKTADETEIKVENWRVKRIAELEEENRNLKEVNKKLGEWVDKLTKDTFGVAEENKKLKEERDMLIEDLSSDKELQQQIAQKQIDYYEENKKLKEELEEIKNTLEHRDSFFSIMRDVLANETITNNEIAMIVYCVVHEECGDYDLSEKELEVVKKFWNRDYV